MKLLYFTFVYMLTYFASPEVLVAQQLPKPDHIVIVIEENKDYTQIIGSSSAPYINNLAKDTMSTLFTNFYAEQHPSQPNYLWLFSGSNQGVNNDNLPSGLPFTTPNLGAELLQKGFTFIGYSEDLPSVGYTGVQSGNYVRKHNPWVNWQNSSTNGIPDTLNVPLTSFPSNYSKLPTVSFVIPNLQDDMHDGSISKGDTWLKNNLDSYIQWAKTHNSLFVFTFDEDNNDGKGNRIVTIFTGQMVKQVQSNQKLNHLNLLRTLEDIYGLGHAGSSNDSTSITNCWVNSINSVKGDPSIVKRFNLEQNYPNPFNPGTKINYSIPYNSFVNISVYNVIGEKVSQLVNKNMNSGNYEIYFNAENLPSGIYFYTLKANSYSQTRKMILLK